MAHLGRAVRRDEGLNVGDRDTPVPTVELKRPREPSALAPAAYSARAPAEPASDLGHGAQAANVALGFELLAHP